MPVPIPRAVMPALAALAALAVACGTNDAPPDDADDTYDHVLAFDTAGVRIVTASDTVRLAVQVAASDAQRTLGLMERRHLAPDAGMLFVYAATQPDSAGFWMFRTRLPLDIAFVDSAGGSVTLGSAEPFRTIG